MSGRLTLWGAGELLRCFFTQASSPPGSFWLALIREIPPTPYLSGAELDEPDADDYARVQIYNDLASWSNDSTPQEMFNLGDTEFVTATSDWGQIGFWALCNSPVDGFNYVVGDLESPIMVEAGIQPVLREGDLSVTLGPFYLVEED